MSAPQPTLASGAVLVKISASGPIATSRYCDHRPSSISASLSRAASSRAGDDRADRRRRSRASSLSRIAAAASIVAARALLDHPLDRRDGEGDAGRLDAPAGRSGQGSARAGSAGQLVDVEQAPARGRNRDRRGRAGRRQVGATSRHVLDAAAADERPGSGPRRAAIARRALRRRHRQAAFAPKRPFAPTLPVLD